MSLAALKKTSDSNFPLTATGNYIRFLSKEPAKKKDTLSQETKKRKVEKD